MEMSAHIIEAANAQGTPRFIFASSNHVFGKYWREGTTLSEAGAITVDTPPHVGTDFRVPAFECDATPYAAAKLAGECILKATVAANPKFSGIALRIGWCQPGRNLPDTMSATGTPSIEEGDVGEEEELYSQLARGYDDDRRVLQWFQNMWLSNRDMLQVFERCSDWEGSGFQVVNGMSNNEDMRWDISNPIGYAPVDDVSKEIQLMKECAGAGRPY